METRIHSVDEIRELENHLAFNQFDVHLISPASKNIIIDLYKTFESIEDRIEYKSLYKALGIYFAFYARDKKKAAEYFKKYQSFCAKDSMEETEALCYLGYSYVIDPHEKDHRIFSDVISRLPSESMDVSVEIIRTFALQNLALILHRQSIRDKSKDIDTALVHIKTAIATYEKLVLSHPSLKIFLAESLHIHAVMLARMGKIRDNRNYLEEADIAFQKATTLAKEFCEETKSCHFLLPIIKQSHAMTIMVLNPYDHDTPLHMLKEALTEQRLRSASPIDLVKGLHLLGDFHTEKREYALAVECYLEALIYQMKIEYDDNEMVIKTQNYLLSALHSIRENKKLACDLREKILFTMSRDDTDHFNSCDDFFQLINHEKTELKKELMDEVSLKFMGTSNTLFAHPTVRPEKRDNDFDIKPVGMTAPCA